MNKIPLINLDKQYSILKNSILSRFEDVLNSGKYILGDEVVEVEKQLAEFTGRKFCLTCSSGTDALVMALMAKDIGPGDKIITTPFTFIATAEAICLVGATPVFVDIDPGTFNISTKQIENYFSNSNTHDIKGVIAVDLFGLPCDYPSLEKFCSEKNIFLVEDAAQGLGGKIGKRKSGSFGEISTTSFYPAKPLGCYGDGGAVFTDDPQLNNVLSQIRVHGESKRYISHRLGINGRFDTIQAAVILEKLKIFNKELRKRNSTAEFYKKNLDGSKITFQDIPDKFSSAWAQFSVLTQSNEKRKTITQKFEKRGIGYGIYYPVPLHLQPVFSFLNYHEEDFPVSEEISQKILSLPFSPYICEDDVLQVCEILISNT